ncbi:MAG TPA: lipoprotein-releasing ABC transporter permease subunit [Holosporales bacterium]|nr:lipoprotein-releasing ABC transporter permease subunit [Holosporales bacterium]
MFSPFERKVALRYLFSSKKEGFVSFFAIFSFLGIALGVATLIIVMSVMNGFRANLLTAIIGMRGHVLVMQKNQPIESTNTTLMHTIHEESIESAYPMIEKQSIISFRGQTKGVMLQGIEPSAFSKREPLRKSIDHESLKNFKNDGVLLGSRLAMELGIRTGDRFSMITPEGNQTAFGTIPRQKSFRVAGIFHYGMHIYDKSFIFMPLDTAQNLYKMGDKVTHIDIFLKDVLQASLVAQNLSKQLNDKYLVLDWKHQDQAIFHTVEVERNVMLLILTLLIIIAGFNITSSLIMMVKDKTRAIGILKTFGATQKQITHIFVSIGLIIGFVGTFLGVGLGSIFVIHIENIQHFIEYLIQTELFSAEAYFLSKLPAVLSIKDILFACTISTSLSLLASFFPARRAGSLNPVEALKE